MKIIIPMAGFGQRFVDAGYEDPKPLIKVNNKRIIEYILDIFSDEDEFIFICNENHIQTTDIKKILLSLKPKAKIIEIPNHKKGPVHTVSYCYDLIKDDEEVIVSYCDNPFLHNKNDFFNFLKINNPDGCIFSHSGFHPHSLNSTKMAFMKTNGKLVEEIKEKECYTDNHLNEHASTGTYYFKKGSYIKKYFPLTIEKNINYNGEYYVTLVYNLLIKDNLKIMYYDTPFVTVFGTPEEVRTFEAWNMILHSGQVKTENDLLNSYRYWKMYNSNFYNQVHKKNNKDSIALVDIDETICFYNSSRIYEDAVPNHENIEKINNLYKNGWKIIYWTSRGSSDVKNIERLKYIRELTLNQLKEWNALFHELQIGDKKMLYDLIIDDKAKRIEEL